MIEGISLELGGTAYVVPPFPLKLIRLHPDWIKTVRQVDDVPTPDQVEAMVGIIHGALARNYPELTPEQVEDFLDVRNMLDVLKAVMNVSGMVPVAAGGAEGEAGGPA